MYRASRESELVRPVYHSWPAASRPMGVCTSSAWLLDGRSPSGTLLGQVVIAVGKGREGE